MAASYDKLLLFCALLALSVSFLLLNILVDREKTNLERVRAEGPRGPTHDAEALDICRLEEGLASLADPFRISSRPNRLMVPEVRIMCVGCGRPIPYEAEICPFSNCLEPQPGILDDREKDSDLDGMPDWWEIKHGFDPFNPDDAHQDADGDGFTNLEHYLWGTDPRDPESSPPPVGALRLLGVGRLPMPLSFQGVSRAPDSGLIFTLRHRAMVRDYHVRMGDVVEGYELVDYQQKTRYVKRDGLVSEVRENVSTLTLRRNDRDYVLTIYRTDHRGENAARLVWLIDNTEHTLLAGDEFSLKKNNYMVVDIAPDAVIVEDIEMGLRVSVCESLAQPEGGRRAVVDNNENEMRGTGGGGSP